MRVVEFLVVQVDVAVVAALALAIEWTKYLYSDYSFRFDK